MPVSRSQSAAPQPVPLTFRHLTDLIVCLLVTVILVRTFGIEGYMISTGSMAPGLLGYHKRVVCPECDQVFQLGVAFDESVPADQLIGGDAEESEPRTCRCPNCGQEGIDVTRVPRVQGDQLLVHKNAFLFRQPRRFEVVVFRNPALATEAYVKRVIGLPGERVWIRDGNIFINGELLRKTLSQQRALRIPVFDRRHQPRDARWQPRWTTDNGWAASPNGFSYAPNSDRKELLGDAGWSWVTYRHWIRSGGRHMTKVAVDPVLGSSVWEQLTASDEAFPFIMHDHISFDAVAGEFHARGVLSPKLRDQLLSLAEDRSFRRAILELEAASHVAPISDVYGYNTGQESQAVDELCVELVAETSAAQGRLAVQLVAGAETWECAVDLAERTISILRHSSGEIVRSAPLPPSAFTGPTRLEVSVIDDQVLAAIEGELAVEPFVFERTSGSPPASVAPVRIGASGIQGRIGQLCLYRDVHYTRGRARNGVEEEYPLGRGEYFVLGDNSPVSSDSRNWDEAPIRHSHLIGKPFIVHLPSQPRKIQFGGTQRMIRVPDLSRIRYIR